MITTEIVLTRILVSEICVPDISAYIFVLVRQTVNGCQCANDEYRLDISESDFSDFQFSFHAENDFF